MTMRGYDLRRANLNILIVFESLMSERHVGRAAARLGLTQSAISHSLSRLREILGDPLFVRNPRGVTPTPRALELSTSVTQVLETAHSILRSPASFDVEKPHVFSIGATDGSISAVLVPMIAKLRAEAPNISLRIKPIQIKNVAAAIDAMDIDMAISVFPLRIARLAVFPTIKLKFVGIARRGHPALRKQPLSARAYAELSHLVVSTESEPVEAEDAQLAAMGLKRNIVVVEPSFLAAPLIVANTDLVATMDVRLAALFAEPYGLQTFELPVAPAQISIDLLMSRARLGESSLRWLQAQISAWATASDSNPFARRTSPSSRKSAR